MACHSATLLICYYTNHTNSQEQQGYPVPLQSDLHVRHAVWYSRHLQRHILQSAPVGWATIKSDICKRLKSCAKFLAYFLKVVSVAKILLCVLVFMWLAENNYNCDIRRILGTYDYSNCKSNPACPR